MSFQTNKKELDLIIEKYIFEDFNYASMVEQFGTRATAPGGNELGIETDNFDFYISSMEENQPVDVTSLAGTQAFHERPPVEDLDYIPTTSFDLSTAIQALSETLSEERIKQIYYLVRKLAISPEDVESDIMVVDESNVKKFKYLNNLVEKIRQNIEFNQLSIEKKLDFIVEKLNEREKNSVKNQKILRGLKVIQEQLNKNELRNLHVYSRLQFLKQLKPYLDDDKLNELKANKTDINNLESYRFFFINSFLWPVYNELVCESKNRIKNILIKNEYPESFAIFVGDILVQNYTPGVKEFKAKLAESFNKTLSHTDVQNWIKNLKLISPKLTTISEIKDIDIVHLSKMRWESLSIAQRDEETRTMLETTNAITKELTI